MCILGVLIEVTCAWNKACFLEICVNYLLPCVSTYIISKENTMYVRSSIPMTKRYMDIWPTHEKIGLKNRKLCYCHTRIERTEMQSQIVSSVDLRVLYANFGGS